MKTSHPQTPASFEFQNARLGDARRSARLARIADQLAQAPEASLPDKADDPSQLEGTYRFLNNPHVEPEDVLAPHQACVVGRAKQRGLVYVLHDTTEFGFGGTCRSGLGPLAGGKREGFFTHLSFCVAPTLEPLGTLDMYCWVRDGKAKGKRSQQALQYDPDRESLRWPAAVHNCAELLHGHAEAIHVMDREADCFEWLAEMVEHGYRFVVRVCHDRRLDPNRKAKHVPMTFEVLQSAPVMMQREVPLTARRQSPANRPPVKTERFPLRNMRNATLQVRAKSLEPSPGNGSALHLPGKICVNYIEVSETHPPEGEAPVLWRLVTTEPIDTPQQIAGIVDAYCARWLIEEFFKAIKTGCRYEDLQLETARALLLALPIYAAVAWRLLRLRWMDRHAPDAPASHVLTQAQLAVLRAKRKRDGKPLPLSPTVRDVLTAIARLGGHLPQNGRPGWQVLGRGMDKLLDMELGWLAAMEGTD
jgi:hypothetical protein